MNEILQQILTTRKVTTSEGQERPLHSNVQINRGLMIQEIIRTKRPKTCIEIGLAYGISGLFICEALSQLHMDGVRQIVIDPNQHTQWEGIGIENLKRAGYKNMVEFYEEPSHSVLPKLADQKLRVDFAFIDGMHLFDYVLVDFFYLDKLLNVGGVLIIDDVWMRSLRKARDYILTNRKYRILKYLKPHWTSYPKHVLKILMLHYKDIFSANFWRRKIRYTDLVVLTKEAEDNRDWKFHREF